MARCYPPPPPCLSHPLMLATFWGLGVAGGSLLRPLCIDLDPGPRQPFSSTWTP